MGKGCGKLFKWLKENPQSLLKHKLEPQGDFIWASYLFTCLCETVLWP